jgi:hypothetical protein
MTIEPIYITWLNYLGGFEYFLFTARKDYGTEVEEVVEQDKNIFNNWPSSYGAFADTIKRQVYRKTRDYIIVRSQHLTRDQLDAIQWIKKSPLVQIIESRTNRRTVLVDADSFIKYSENDDLYSIQFVIRFTDNNPSQTV